MKPNVLSITFETMAQKHKDGQFTIPKEIRDIMGLDFGDNILLEIKGRKINSQLRSGPEIYGEEIKSLVKAGELIIVTIRRN
ncbi:MAG: hypothetical protein ACOYZ8_18750 [Chloroflexota bacterium]